MFLQYWDVDLIGAPIRDRDPEKNWKNTQKFTQFTQVSGIDKYIKNHQFFIILPLDWNSWGITTWKTHFSLI